MSQHPAFFKFFIDEISNTKLEIPSSFIRSIERALPEQVYLRCRCNNTWEVKVAQIEDDWYFSDGWAKFIIDNMVKNGDLLVFQYFCRNAFNVKLYGPNAIEKNLVGRDMHQGAEKEDDEHVSTEDDNDGDGDGDGGDDDDDDDIDDEVTQSDDNDHILQMDEPVNTDGAESSRNRRERRRRSNADWYGADIFRAGLAQQPVNPYFVTTRGNRKSDLYIPKDIAKHSNLDFTEDLLLVDPQGREFPAKCKKWKDGRIVVTGGWGRLCRINLVEEEHKCICEFIQGRDDGRLVLNVTIVRANRQ